MTCLTLFAGAGGADIGISAAGFTHIACVEGDATACKTLEAAGFPAVHAWIGGAGPKGQPQWVWGGTPIDMLWASPPCQPWSSLGKRQGSSDERDGWPATLAIVAHVAPVWVVVENVVGCPVEAWADLLRPLYSHVCVWRADAADWGLPSHRKRVYIVAGPHPWDAPRPTHYGPDVPWMLRAGRKPWVSFQEAIGHPGAIRATSPPEMYVLDREEQLIVGPSQCIPARYCRVLGLGGQPYVRVETGGDVYRRCLVPEECAALVGFPGGYPFHGGDYPKYRQIGNAVAPIMAQAICQRIKEACQ